MTDDFIIIIINETHKDIIKYKGFNETALFI